MKKKFTIINVLLAMAVLFSLLFPSIHCFEHHSAKLEAKQCQNPHSKNKTEVTHNDGVTEKCFTCTFVFSSFTPPEFYTFEFQKNSSIVCFSSIYSFEHSSFFKGSFFSLRAPPAV